MSPARARTSLDQIVAAGRDLLDAGGVDAVTMLAVADRVGVKAPSLYKRLRSRNELLAAIASATLEDLAERLEPLTHEPDPVAGLSAAAETVRAFAHARPREYELLFAHLPPEARPSPEQNAQMSGHLVAIAERLVGPDQALEAARLVTAFAHGFISMELAGAFRLGGDLDEAYRYGVDALVGALARRGGIGGPVDRDRSDRNAALTS